VPPGQSKVAHKLDVMMEQASEALVRRRYFECERLSAEALRRAIGALDFDRIARIVLPLQEARRQIRDLAVDSGRIVEVNGALPAEGELKAGMYLLSPPRVGVDGRLLREMALKAEVPVMVLVREPLTRTGMWPIVAVGPVTVRTQIQPPAPARAASKAKARPGGKASGKKAAAEAGGAAPKVTAKWMLRASETLGDAAIAALGPGLGTIQRVLAIAERLEAVPDHEKLHQRLEEAAREAARIPPKKRAVPRPEVPLDGEG
jgi:hypothetical protein